MYADVDSIDVLGLNNRKQYKTITECKELFADVMNCIFDSFFLEFDVPSTKIGNIVNQSIDNLSIQWISDKVVNITKLSVKQQQQTNDLSPSGEF